MSNSLDPDDVRQFVPDLGPGYQQTTLVDKELRNRLMAYLMLPRHKLGDLPHDTPASTMR